MIAALIIGAALLVIAFAIVRKLREGFENYAPLNVSPELFTARVVPSGYDEDSALSPGAAMSPVTEKIVASAALPAMSVAEAESNWGAMTSQRCYKTDIGEALKPVRNFLQRTNNYARTHPDDCSAPNHEFIGTFYNPFDGVGRTPECGSDYPVSTQCAKA
jgi:hypothetical protein